MPRVQLPISNGFYESRSLLISGQRCTNLYPHINRLPSFAQESLYGTPGIIQLASSGGPTEANRGGHEMAGIAYFVNGTTLYRLNRNLTSQGAESFDLEALGTIEGNTRVSMADNGSQLCVLVPGGKGYIYNSGASPSFQEITDPDFRANGNPEFVRYVDGYFVFNTDQDLFIVSALNDGLSYNALDFGSAEADPDGIITPVVLRNELYLAGRYTLEPFRNVGGADFPFARLEGGVINVGCLSPFSVVNVAQTFMFIGGSENDNPAVYAFTGSGVEEISTDAINFLLEQLAPEQLDNVFGWFYSEGGARFVGWTLPTKTIVYDLTSQRWHERSSFAVQNGTTANTRWRVNSIVQAYNRLIVGDFIDGRVGELNLDIYTEYDQPIVREITTQPFNNQTDRILVPWVELVCEAGVGNNVEQNPKISMARSTDGVSFGSPRTLLVGKKGRYEQRTIWRRCGRAARQEVFRWTMSDPVKWVLIAAWAEIK